jgi:hypothetical protein
MFMPMFLCIGVALESIFSFSIVSWCNITLCLITIADFVENRTKITQWQRVQQSML